MSTRLFLRIIRDHKTRPSTLLDDGSRADKKAFEYMKKTILTRNSRKRKVYHLTKKKRKKNES